MHIANIYFIRRISVSVSVNSRREKMWAFVLSMLLVFAALGISSPVKGLAAENNKVSRYGPYRPAPTAPSTQKAVSPSSGSPPKPQATSLKTKDFVPGRVLIKMASAPKAMNMEQQSARLSALGIIGMERLFPQARPPSLWEMILTPTKEGLPTPDLTLWYQATLPQDADVLKTVQEVQKEPDVAWAEPDYLRRPLGLPSGPTGAAAGSPREADPLSDQQWHLAAAKVPEARAYLSSQGKAPGGSRDVVVAVIDTGVDYNHPDLAGNMWFNSQEIPGNGWDDDGNGYADDIYGVNVVSNTGNPMDDQGHGTHVAGIIAAAANGAGGEGVAYNVRIMAIKAAQASGALAVSDIVKGIEYAVVMGADIINMSFGSYIRSQAEEDALTLAWSQAVLVAGAGNDGKVNLPGGGGADMYPAAYNWVLGVMASDQNGERTSWSNYDYAPRDLDEYELMAPGVSIWSTLPDNQYTAWSGTSMSAAVVSGVAALVRTGFPDKTQYSPGFIMGQIAKNAPGGVDAYAALVTAPRPDLSYQQHYGFDPNNNNNSLVIAGATIDLGLVVRNHWGQADEVTVQLEAVAEGAEQPDPYITMVIDRVVYGSIGSFHWKDNGLIKNSAGAVTGVQNPFRFQVSTDTPDNHIIPFKLTMTAKNGLAPGDSNYYTYTSRFNITVQRGKVLPSVISQDMTLTKDYLWIVAGPLLVKSGATLTINPGTQVQWGSSSYPSVTPYIELRGSLIARGTYAEPIKLFGLYVKNPEPTPGYYKSVIIYNYATEIILQYIHIMNPDINPGEFSVDHGYLYGANMASSIDSLSNSIVKVDDVGSFMIKKIDTCLFDTTIQYNNHASIGHGTQFISNSAFLQNNQYNYRICLMLTNQTFDISSAIASTSHIKNAFLSKYCDQNTDHWMSIQPIPMSGYFGATNNYWGTTSTSLIDQVIYDFYDDFTKAEVVYQPILTTPAESTYPFVVDCAISDKNGQRTEQVGVETATFTISYNRDMDTAVQPQVSFGPDGSDFTVSTVVGGWRDARTWVGTFEVTPVTGDGYQYMRISGGRAASDPWLVCGDDVGRFRFQIVTSGTITMKLQAEIRGSGVQLSWAQNDFSTLAGYHLYRATGANNDYSRLNSSVIPRQMTQYMDNTVKPGNNYYYKYTVVTTANTESQPSNIVQVSISDTIPPEITHTAITSAVIGQPITFLADVTDNVAVQGVTLHFRKTGTSTYTSRAMVNVSGSRYSSTVEGSLVTAAGLEYYIAASDGINTGKAANENSPYRITAGNLHITATSGANGSIYPNGEIEVNFRGSQIFTITPATGYHVDNVAVDGAWVGAVASYTFTNVIANHSIEVVFAINTYSISASAGANGSIWPPGEFTVNFGDSQTYSIYPNTGYHVDDVLVDGISVGAQTSYTFSNIADNHTIAASFAINTYTITASAGLGGTISPPGQVKANYGATPKFTIQAASGYNIQDVKVNGESVGPVSSYTFPGVTADQTIEATFVPSVINIVTDKDVVQVPKGKSAILQVKLDAAPTANVVVNAAKTGGTNAISLQGGTSLAFTPSNWNTYQSLNLTASADDNDINGVANIALTGSGFTDKNVTAVKVKNAMGLEGVLELLLD